MHAAPHQSLIVGLYLHQTGSSFRTGMSRRRLARQTNRYGLSRHIPGPIARKVRQRCGFGCVICGSIIYTYHHIDPPFNQAQEHNPENIVLLCGSCHTRATKGLLSSDSIKRAAENPECLKQGFSHIPLDIGDHFPVVLIGNSTFVGNPTIIRAFRKPLFTVGPPEEPRGPFRISATFYDRLGKEACRIAKNEWQGLISNWDITSTGREITIRRAHRQIALKMRLDPPNQLIIKNLDMSYKGFRIAIEDNGQVATYLPNGTEWFRLNGATFIGNDAVIVIE